jgi:hypothetical protein
VGGGREALRHLRTAVVCDTLELLGDRPQPQPSTTFNTNAS